MCNAACRAKIILNGARVQAEISAVMELLNADTRLSEKEGFALIKILDEAEDKLIQYNNRLLEKTGYKRRTEKFLLEDLDG